MYELQHSPSAPSDWNVHWRDKYYTKTTTTIEIEGQNQNFYTYNGRTENTSTYQSNQTYYYVNDAESKPMQYLWWTRTGNTFGLSNTWIRTEAPAAAPFPYYFDQSVKPLLGAAQEFDSSLTPQLWWTAGGVNGTPIGFNVWSAPTVSPSSTSTMALAPTDSQEFNKYIPDFISFEYDGDIYIGFVVVQYGVDGVPVNATITAISEEFWKDEHSSSYTGPISQAGGGDGLYTGRDDQKGKRGSLSSYNFAGTAPGAMGYKMTAMKLDTLSDIQSKYLNYIRTTTGIEWITTLMKNPQDVLDIMQKSIQSVYKVPIDPRGSSYQNQWQFMGDTFNLDSGHNVWYNMSRYTYKDMGYVDMTKWYDSFLDYDPYTYVQIYLPFIGTFDLPVSDIMRGQLHLEYYQDNMNGDLLARLTCYNSDFPIPAIYDNALSPYWHLIGEFTGNGAMNIPYVASATTGTMYGLGQALKGAVLGGAGTQFVKKMVPAIGQASAALANHAVGRANGTLAAAQFEGGDTTAAEFAHGLKMKSINKKVGIANSIISGVDKTAPLVGAAVGALNQFVNMVPATSAVISSYSGNPSYMGTLTPYIKIVRALYSEPLTQGHDKAYPSNVSYKISELPKGSLNIAGAFSFDNGFTNATDQEKDAIIKILTSGFYR